MAFQGRQSIMASPSFGPGPGAFGGGVKPRQSVASAMPRQSIMGGPLAGGGGVRSGPRMSVVQTAQCMAAMKSAAATEPGNQLTTSQLRRMSIANHQAKKAVAKRHVNPQQRRTLKENLQGVLDALEALPEHQEKMKQLKATDILSADRLSEQPSAQPEAGLGHIGAIGEDSEDESDSSSEEEDEPDEVNNSLVHSEPSSMDAPVGLDNSFGSGGSSPSRTYAPRKSILKPADNSPSKGAEANVRWKPAELHPVPDACSESSSEGGSVGPDGSQETSNSGFSFRNTVNKLVSKVTTNNSQFSRPQGMDAMRTSSAPYCASSRFNEWNAMRWEYTGSQSRMFAFRLWGITVLDSTAFEQGMAMIVLLNIAVVAADAEARIGQEEDSSSWLSALAVLDIACLMVYTLELLLRFVSYGREIELTMWNCMDFMIVVFGILGELMSLLDDSFMGDLLPYLRVFKLFRVVRVLRAVRTFGFLRPLRMITHDITGIARLVTAGFVLILLETLIFAIFGMELLHNKVHEEALKGSYDALGGTEARCATAFSTLFLSFSSLFGILTLDQWGEIAYPIAVSLPWTLPYFMLFVFCTTYGVVRMLAASMVLVPQEWVKNQEEFAVADRLRQREEAHMMLAQIFADLDPDDSGTVTFDEFSQVQMHSPQFMRVMLSLDIGPEDLQTVWNLLDMDGNGEITKDEFLDVMWRLQSSETKWTLMRTCKVATVTNLKIDELAESTEARFKGLHSSLRQQRNTMQTVARRIEELKLQQGSSLPSKTARVVPGEVSRPRPISHCKEKLPGAPASIDPAQVLPPLTSTFRAHALSKTPEHAPAVLPIAGSPSPAELTSMSLVKFDVCASVCLQENTASSSDAPSFGAVQDDESPSAIAAKGKSEAQRSLDPFFRKQDSAHDALFASSAREDKELQCKNPSAELPSSPEGELESGCIRSSWDNLPEKEVTPSGNESKMEGVLPSEIPGAESNDELR